jgi:hypothetical protein
MMAAIWLMGQCSLFIRHREQLADPPVSLDLNEAAVERLAKLVVRGYSRDWSALHTNKAHALPPEFCVIITLAMLTHVSALLHRPADANCSLCESASHPELPEELCQRRLPASASV